MRVSILTFVLALTSSVLFSQKKISDEVLNRLKTEITQEANKLKDSLAKEADEFTSEIAIDFKYDIFQIIELRKRRMEIDYSTAGMSAAIYEEEKGYDKLLNKYYAILKKKLSKEDQLILKQSQLNWLRFRDSERKLNGLITHEYYSGGGSIQSNIRAGKFCEITRRRLFEIVAYLDRFINE